VIPGRRGAGGLVIAAGSALALVVVGAAIEGADLFPRLRFAIQRTFDDLPSTTALDPRDLQSGLPTMSLVVDPAVLKDLLENKLEHGRAWERPAFLSYFEERKVRFGAQAGVRIHGGGSRITSEKQSFRVFFRRDYGAARAPAHILLDSSYEPLRRLVIHNDVRVDGNGVSWHLANPLAYDFARRLGCITPATKPVRFFLNGEFQGLYVLKEHFDDEYFEAHMPGRPITMPIEPMEQLRERIDQTHPLTMQAAAELLDLENVTNWFLAVVFAATRDAYQGPGQFLDEARERAPWFWVTWDLDESFRDWDLDSFQYLLERVGERPRGRRASEPRATVLTRLIAGDAGYRAYLAGRVDDMLNHQLTQAYIDARASHYSGIARAYGVRSLAYVPRLHAFLQKRGAFVRGMAEQWLNTPPGVGVRVRSADGGLLVIDGFDEASPYVGTYTPGREIRIRVADGTTQSWYVNGRQVANASEIRVTADAPLAITVGGPAAEADRPDPEPPVAALPAAAPLAWRQIQGRSFEAGCVTDRDRRCRSSEVPRERVELERRYQMTATEITAGQFRAYAHRAGVTPPRQPPWSSDAHPVVNITWNEAATFCQAQGARLPTEAEWEFAARGGNADGIFPWGDRFDPAHANGIGVAGADDSVFAAPAGSLPSNAYGLHDMIGNVWEWTADWYREGEGWTSAPASDPQPGSAEHLKTVRGGSWDSAHENLRVSRRVGLSPQDRHNMYVGFRCVQGAPAGGASID
jgi:formylglycine-generating enzyme required for sulfatase activity